MLPVLYDFRQSRYCDMYVKYLLMGGSMAYLAQRKSLLQHFAQATCDCGEAD